MNGNVELYTCVNSTRGGLVRTHPRKPGLCKLALANPLREVRDFSQVELVY